MASGDRPAASQDRQDSPSPPPSIPPDEECGEQIRRNEIWVCLTSATMQGDQLVIEYEAEWAGNVPDQSLGYHIHLYGGDGTNPPEETMGGQYSQQGLWMVEDQNPAVLSPADVAEVIGDAPKVCARIANADHGLVPEVDGGYHTGNCIPIQR